MWRQKLKASEEILWIRCQGYGGPIGRLRDGELRQGAKGIEDPQADLRDNKLRQGAKGIEDP